MHIKGMAKRASVLRRRKSKSSTAAQVIALSAIEFFQYFDPFQICRFQYDIDLISITYLNVTLDSIAASLFENNWLS